MRPIDAEPLEEILRSRCAQYSNDHGSLAGAISGCLKLVQAQPTISPPPNAPLTLEELREMDGEPVWVVSMENMFASCWMLVWIKNNFVLERFQFCNFMDYGKTWLAYRRRPEEGRT